MSYPIQIIKSENAEILKKIYRVPHQNNGMIVIIVVGKPNSGKSYGVLDLAKKLDPTFTIDNIVFSAASFMKLIVNLKGKGKFIFFDDAGIAMFNRDAMTKQVKELAKVFQSYRFKNAITVLTLPNLNNLENVVVSVSDALIEMKNINRKKRKSWGSFKWLTTSPLTGKVYKKYTTKKIFQELANGMVIRRKIRQKKITFDYPDKNLIKEYEITKQTYLNRYYLKTAKLLDDTPEAIAERKKVKKKTVFSELFDRAIPIRKMFVRKDDFDVVKIMAHFDVGESIAKKIKHALKLFEEGELKGSK